MSNARVLRSVIYRLIRPGSYYSAICRETFVGTKTLEDGGTQEEVPFIGGPFLAKLTARRVSIHSVRRYVPLSAARAPRYPSFLPRLSSRLPIARTRFTNPPRSSARRFSTPLRSFFPPPFAPPRKSDFVISSTTGGGMLYTKRNSPGKRGRKVPKVRRKTQGVSEAAAFTYFTYVSRLRQ